MSDPNTLGELIRERRLARGLSLGQLATSVGRTAATVRGWERGLHFPATDVIERLALALDLDPGHIEDLMVQEPPSLTVVADEPEDEITSESTTVSAQASVESPEGEGDDDTAEIGIVESAPASAADAEGAFVAAAPDELGVMPRIQIEEAPAAPVAAEAIVDELPGIEAAEVEVPEAVDEITPPAVEEEAAPIVDTEGAPTDGPDVVYVEEIEPLGVEEIESPVADEVDQALIDEPTEAIGPPIAPPEPASEPAGHVGVAVRAEMLREPDLPPFLAPLRAIFDPHKKWLYWIRGALTITAMLVMLVVLAWAAGALFDGLGEVLDTIESTDDLASDLVPLN